MAIPLTIKTALKDKPRKPSTIFCTPTQPDVTGRDVVFGPSRAREHTAEHERAFMARALSGIAGQEQAATARCSTARLRSAPVTCAGSLSLTHAPIRRSRASTVGGWSLRLCRRHRCAARRRWVRNGHRCIPCIGSLSLAGQVVNAIDGIANVMERCRRAKCSSLSEYLTPHFAIRDPRTLRSLRSAEPPAMPAARGFIPDDRRTSAHVSDAPLGCFLGWRFWLCRKLKHRCLLTLA
jgi:hypothetical protein